MKLPSLLTALAAFAPVALLAQGDLNPAGPPGPTMRTLLQIEPRTPISSLPFNITNGGAYYLTGNLSGGEGITISTSDVDLDLMGFTLTGAGGSNSGVVVPGTQMNVTIHNGVLKNWGGLGINASNVSNGQLERLRASSNFGGGLAIGPACQVNNCETSRNGFDGITVGANSGVKDCYSRTNGRVNPASGGSGIVGGTGVSISGCVVAANYDFGIVVGDNSSVSSCLATLNGRVPGPPTGRGAGIKTGNNCTIQGCTADANALHANFEGDGIVAGDGSTVRDCTANKNSRGIFVGANSTVQSCTASFSIADSPGTGIQAGADCLIRGCTANGNNYANIEVSTNCVVQDNICLGANRSADIGMHGGGNTVIRNTVSAFIAVGASRGIQVFGPSTNNIIGTIETFSTLNTNKNPHANITQ